MKVIFSIVILSVITWIAPINGANILYISLTPSPSHHIWDKTLAMALRARGHTITFLTHSPEKSVENFTTIIFEGVYEKLHEAYDYEEFSKMSYYDSIIMLFDWFTTVNELDPETEGFKQFMKLVNSKPKFDLIIQDTTTAHFLYPVYDLLGNPPIIGTSQFGIQAYHTYSMGIDIHYAYSPIFTLPYTDKMTFLQRVQNYYYTTIYLIYRQMIYMPAMWKGAKKIFGNDITPYEEAEKKYSILLANYDPILDYPVSLPPTIIPVGGLHTRREKSLPQDLKKLLDESKEGIILFSLGTNFLSKDLKEDQKQALIKGLGRLKQKVLWKYEEEITGLPKNIITKTWLPQNDILAHPNVKVFITHGGGLSTQEAMYHGMAVVSMPFFADQYVNTEKVFRRKLGLSLTYGKLTSDIVYKTLSEVINNPIYKKNAETLAKRYRDQKEDPLTRAIWWIEYTIRQGGAQHLAVASRDLEFYQLNMLDFWALVFVGILGIYIVSKKICCYFCKSKKSDQKKKTN